MKTHLERPGRLRRRKCIVDTTSSEEYTRGQYGTLVLCLRPSATVTPGAPRASIERYILRAVRGELGSWMTVLLTPVVYAWFFIFELVW
ncbi:hypothetical protein BST61_g4721 [Cercospora zeina]